MQLRGVPGRAGRYGSCMGSHALISGLEGRRLRWALRLAAASAVAGIAGVTQAQPQLQSAPARVFDDRARARVLADEAANAYARGNFEIGRASCRERCRSRWSPYNEKKKRR